MMFLVQIVQFVPKPHEIVSLDFNLAVADIVLHFKSTQDSRRGIRKYVVRFFQ